MECIRCGRQTPEKDDLFCCADCLIAVTIKLPADSDSFIEDFRKHEAGTIVGEENMEFLGRITRAGLVPHLNSHYKRLTENIRSCRIMREDGTIDLEHYRQVRKSHDQQEYQRHSH